MQNCVGRQKIFQGFYLTGRVIKKVFVVSRFIIITFSLDVVIYWSRVPGGGAKAGQLLSMI